MVRAPTAGQTVDATKVRKAAIRLGEYKDNKKDGYGKMVAADGNILEGFWKNGVQHGLGMYVTREETKFGIWNSGRCERWLLSHNPADLLLIQNFKGRTNSGAEDIKVRDPGFKPLDTVQELRARDHPRLTVPSPFAGLHSQLLLQSPLPHQLPAAPKPPSPEKPKRIPNERERQTESESEAKTKIKNGTTDHRAREKEKEKEKERDKDEEMLCKICFHNKNAIALIPCGHLFCKECTQKMAQCPLDSQPITRQVTIYY